MDREYRVMIMWYICRSRIETCFNVCRQLGQPTEIDGKPLSILQLYESISSALDEISNDEAAKWLEFAKNAYHLEEDRGDGWE